MRIAITGSHRTGKTTLLAELARLLPDYPLWPEPYEQLAEEGYLFSAAPSLQDFEAQLERALANLCDSEANALFDRCPLDLLAYLLCHGESGHFVLADWILPIQNTLNQLDLIVYVPIETPDRIHLAASQDADFRAEVDEQLRELLRSWSLPQVLEVRGDLASRMTPILKRIRNDPWPN
ncbi:MAG: ATP-binding protein [Candidatus Sericytochromatia bacterium]